jgi:hypothetical protein
MRPNRCLPLKRMRVSERLVPQGLVEAFLHEFGIAQDGGELSSWLILPTNCDLCWLEQSRVLNGDSGLVGEDLEQVDLTPRKESVSTRQWRRSGSRP